MSASPLVPPTGTRSDGWEELIAAAMEKAEAEASGGVAAFAVLQSVKSKLKGLNQEYATSSDRRQRLLLRAEGCWLLGEACLDPCQRQIYEAMGKRYAEMASARSVN
jgi:hypothetical protein